MRRTTLVLLLAASLLSGKTHDTPAQPQQTYVVDSTVHVRHSHKKMWISIGIIVGTGVLAGTLAAQGHHGSPAYTPANPQVPDLKRIGCAACFGGTAQ